MVGEAAQGKKKGGWGQKQSNRDKALVIDGSMAFFKDCQRVADEEIMLYF